MVSFCPSKETLFEVFERVSECPRGLIGLPGVGRKRDFGPEWSSSAQGPKVENQQLRFRNSGHSNSCAAPGRAMSRTPGLAARNSPKTNSCGSSSRATLQKPKVSLPKLPENFKFQFVPSMNLVTSCAEYTGSFQPQSQVPFEVCGTFI